MHSALTNGTAAESTWNYRVKSCPKLRQKERIKLHHSAVIAFLSKHWRMDSLGDDELYSGEFKRDVLVGQV